MELDATRRRPRFNISRQEFQRRIREQLCLKSAQPGHLPRNCLKKDGPKPFNAQARSWQTTKKIASWQTRPQIREIEVEQEPEQSGNNECPQQEMVWGTDLSKDPSSWKTTTRHSTTRKPSNTTMTILWSRYNYTVERSQSPSKPSLTQEQPKTSFTENSATNTGLRWSKQKTPAIFSLRTENQALWNPLPI